MEHMTEQDKSFITALIDTIRTEIVGLKELFQKDFESVDRRVCNLENKDSEFRDDFRAIYPRVTTLENQVKVLNDTIKQSSGVKQNIITGVITAVLVFVTTYFISKGL